MQTNSTPDVSKLTFNQRLTLAGIKTIRPEEGAVMIEYNGKQIKRPHVGSIEAECKKHFGIEI